MTSLVWYAAFGSNLLAARFLDSLATQHLRPSSDTPSSDTHPLRILSAACTVGGSPRRKNPAKHHVSPP